MKDEYFLNRKKYYDTKLLIKLIDIVQELKSYFRYLPTFYFPSNWAYII